jgi:hypothetical protein
MMRFAQWAFTAVLLIGASVPLAKSDAPPSSPAEQRDPHVVFRQARQRLVALAPKHDLLNGVTHAKPVIERDDMGRLKSASLVFEQNATPPDKGPAKPKDSSKAFVYVSIEVWSGRSQQPPPGLYEFQWKGQTYQMWVRAFCSDAELAKTVLATVDPRMQGPPGLTP